MESLTGSLIAEARKIIQEVEQMGGMAKAIETGMPKLKIEESAARRQARIDQGLDVIVGVNKYTVEEKPLDDVLEVPETVRQEQIERLKQIRETRDGGAVQAALADLTRAAESGANLIETCLPAVRARATVGEISDALEKVFGRYKANTQVVSGVYASEYREQDVMAKLRSRTEAFQDREGRRPRILLAKMGQDGHDRGVKVVATAFADFGFDVDISPMFQTPAEVAKMAVENDVHVVGASSLAAGHKALVPQLIEALKAEQAGDIRVVVGGVIPPADFDYLRAAGAVGVFGPGTSLIKSANEVLDVI
jgi:methylmalonyl-CoA mutase